MGRQPLPLGSWGRIWTSPGPSRGPGKPTYYRARANFRDFDGVRREVEALGRTKSAAEANLIRRMRARAAVRQGGWLTASDRFSVAADLWMERLRGMVSEGRRSPGTLDTYQRLLDRHILPALAEVRLGEFSIPIVDKVIRSIMTEVSPATARSCRSVISGVLGLAARHGAIPANPVRDIERIGGQPKRRPRALTDEERQAWFSMLQRDPRAVAADLPDLTLFMLSTGARIGETLGLTWEDVRLGDAEIDITHQVTRVKGEGLIRTKTKSAAGERTLGLPPVALSMMRRRFSQGIRLHEPVFCDPLGGFRDPTNVRRDLRRARAPVGSAARQALGRALAGVRRQAGLSQRTAPPQLGIPKTRLELLEAGRVQADRSEVVTMLGTYNAGRDAQEEVLALFDDAQSPSDRDALSWVTSHSFRKTTATILDDAGQSARQIADQLGHARPSMTQDVYMGRQTRNPKAAAALESALGSAARRAKYG